MNISFNIALDFTFIKNKIEAKIHGKKFEDLSFCKNVMGCHFITYVTC